VKIRGIYSTALSKVLLDNEFMVTQCSEVIRERLLVEENNETPNVKIKDLKNKRGILVFGEHDHMLKIIDFLRTILPECIFIECKAEVNGVYKGIVEKVNKNFSVINLGEFRGVLFRENLNEGEEILVQVTRPDLRGKDAVVTDYITFAGKYVVLTPNTGIKISRKIKDFKVKETLFMIGQTLNLKDWGIIWRTAAAGKDTLTLIEEAGKLKEKAEKIMKNAKTKSAPVKVLDGIKVAYVVMSKFSKVTLDRIRGEVTFTVPFHHYYKSIGPEISGAVDLAETLISNNIGDKDKILKELEKYVKSKLPRIGDKVEIRHIKPDGKVYRLSPGVLTEADDSSGKYVLRRNFNRGIYDGLNIPIEFGDYGLMEVHMDKWYTKTSYFSKEGKLKGTYYNIITPPEFYPRKLVYIDLEIDVVAWPDGKVEIIDLDRLEDASKKGYITDKLKEKALEVAEEIKNNIRML